VGEKTAWIKLGRFPEMTVEQAQIEALKVLGEFSQGANPATARRALKKEKTFTDVLEDMLENKIKKDGSKIQERTKKDYRDTVRLHVKGVADLKLSSISSSDVKSIHRITSAKSHRQADKAVAIISSVFSYADDEGYFKGENPASKVQKNHAPTRERFVQSNELPYLFPAIAVSSMSDYFLILLLTGARRSNVQSMAWRDIDYEMAIWRIRRTKNGTPQNVTLAPEALAILKAREHTNPSSEFVFPSSSATGHIVEPKKAWLNVLRLASLHCLLDYLKLKGRMTEKDYADAQALIITAPKEAYKKYLAVADALGIDPSHYDMTDLRMHDLRRTLGSWQARAGASLTIIGKSLNHKSIQSTAIYARLDLDPVRESVNGAVRAMIGASGLPDASASD
jgi:integrase